MAITKQTMNISGTTEAVNSTDTIATTTTFLQSQRVNISIVIPDMETVMNTEGNLEAIGKDFVEFLNNLGETYSQIKDQLKVSASSYPAVTKESVVTPESKIAKAGTK